MVHHAAHTFKKPEIAPATEQKSSLLELVEHPYEKHQELPNHTDEETASRLSPRTPDQALRI
jgi:hypothetical protein